MKTPRRGSTKVRGVSNRAPLIIGVAFLCAVLLCLARPRTSTAAPPVFFDDFNGTALDYTRWTSPGGEGAGTEVVYTIDGVEVGRVNDSFDSPLPVGVWDDRSQLMQTDWVEVSQPTCTPPPTGMVAWWPGDGNALDITGGHDGTLERGATFGPGRVGQAFSFDGVDDFVSAPDSTALRMGTGPFTLDAWVKSPPSNTYRAIAAKTGLDYPFASYAIRIASDNRVEFLAVDCSTGACGFWTTRLPLHGNAVVADNTFHHVAGVRRADGTLEIYVDGVLDASRLDPLWDTDSTDPFSIGEIDAQSVPEQPFAGIVDEVELFNRALSASEIQAIYDAGGAGKCKDVCANDTNPPSLSMPAANPNTLWPPNHKMQNVTVGYNATDNCGAVNCAITSVTSNEPVNGTGDGDTAPDWSITDAHHVQLRAERAGSGAGRVYTITVTCTDSAGNAATKSVTVTVPKSQGK